MFPLRLGFSWPVTSSFLWSMTLFQSPSEAFRNVTSEEILKMIEENMEVLPAWVDGSLGCGVGTHFNVVRHEGGLECQSQGGHLSPAFGHEWAGVCSVLGLLGLLPQACGWHSENIGLRVQDRMAGQRVGEALWRAGWELELTCVPPQCYARSKKAGLGVGTYCWSDSLSVVICWVSFSKKLNIYIIFLLFF